ncbi:MAG: SatD family protein [Lachnospiraceae bacterium]|nr:SatD family protein [Lachnospiraceae bacterium]
MGNYVSLIMDIEKSKTYDLPDRNEIQQYIDRCIKNLNELFYEEIQCEVIFSAGDEFQGLFNDVVTALLYFRLFELLVNPVKIRAGVGIGDWTIKMEQGLSTQQDGPAYHKARQAINEAHDKRLQNIRIRSDGDDILANHFINSSFGLKRQQNYMQNIVQVIIELLFPFVQNDFSSKKHDLVKEILADKFEYKLEGLKGSSLRSERGIGIKTLPNVSPIYIDGKIVASEEVIVKKNTAKTISEILQCTRQNVDSVMKRGNTYKIRELDYVALQYVKMNYGRK